MRRFCSLNRTIVAVTIAVVAGIAPGCGSRPAPHAAKSFDAMLDEHRESIDALGNHPDDGLVESLAEAARAEPWSSQASGIYESIILQYPNDTLSLYLIDQIKADATNLPGTTFQDFASRLLKQHPGTASGKKALYIHLAQLKSQDESAFLRTCSELIAAQNDPETAKIALYHRFLHYRDQKEIDLAAVDGIALWHRYGETLVKMNATNQVGALLSRAGLLLEGQILEAEADEETASFRKLMLQDKDLDRALVNPDYATEFLNSMRSRDLAVEIKCESNPEIAAQSNEQIVRARQILAALSDRKYDPAVACADCFAAQLGDLFARAERDPNQLEPLIVTTLVVRRKLGGMLAYDPPSDRALLTAARSAYTRLTNLEKQIRYETAKLAGVASPALLSELTEREVESLRSVADYEKVVAAYEFLWSEYPQSIEGARALYDLAVLYTDTLKSPSLAQKTYERVIESLGDNPNAEVAWLKLATLSYESKDYQEGYAALLEYKDRFPAGKNIANAELLLCFTEAGLGLQDDAETRALDLVKEYPGSDAAPRALHWLGSMYLSRQDYERSREVFEDLIQRYPEHATTVSARDYVARLPRVSSQ